MLEYHHDWEDVCQPFPKVFEDSWGRICPDCSSVYVTRLGRYVVTVHLQFGEARVYLDGRQYWRTTIPIPRYGTVTEERSRLAPILLDLPARLLLEEL